MPNHVTTRMTVTGSAEDVEGFKKRCILREPLEDENNRFFDFNTLVPMPEGIRNSTESSEAEYGMYIMEFDKGNADPLKTMMNWPWVQETGIRSLPMLRDHLFKQFPNCVEKAQQRLANIEKYGHASWYDWSCDKWGTKWNSYGLNVVTDEPGRYEFLFDTAWSPPIPIFEKVAEEFPGINFDVKSFDEGWGFGFVGEGVDGRFFGEDVEPTDEFYEQVYGCKPHKYDEEEVEETN